MKMKYKKPIIPSINKAKIIDRRVVVSGNTLEQFDYEHPYISEYSCGNKKVGRASKNTTEQDKAINREKNLNRARTRVRHLANANPQLNKFFTLTFEKNIGDLKVANKEFQKFEMRMSYYLKKHGYDKFEYIAVPEFQKRGAVHYHLLCKLPYIESTELEKIWRNGYVKINRIDNVDNVGAYITKYMSKDYADERLVGNRCYFTSQGLNEPTVITDNEQIDEILEAIATSTDMQLAKMPYKKTFETEYYGNIEYRQFVFTKPIIATLDKAKE